MEAASHLQVWLLAAALDGAPMPPCRRTGLLRGFRVTRSP